MLGICFLNGASVSFDLQILSQSIRPCLLALSLLLPFFHLRPHEHSIYPFEGFMKRMHPCPFILPWRKKQWMHKWCYFTSRNCEELKDIVSSGCTGIWLEKKYLLTKNGINQRCKVLIQPELRHLTFTRGGCFSWVVYWQDWSLKWNKMRVPSALRTNRTSVILATYRKVLSQ